MRKLGILILGLASFACAQHRPTERERLVRPPKSVTVGLPPSVQDVASIVTKSQRATFNGWNLDRGDVYASAYCERSDFVQVEFTDPACARELYGWQYLHVRVWHGSQSLAFQAIITIVVDHRTHEMLSFVGRAIRTPAH